ncbi:MAG: GNAT family N-acetyltransferase [Verrucomicrobiota bacterium]
MKNVSAAQQVHSLDEVGAATMCRWAEAEGWNPGIHDASTFWNSDPQGFFGLSAEGQLVGTISAVRYGDEFAFVGFFIVRPGSRGHLLGPALARAAMSRIAGMPTGIDGVLENVGKYERIYGFRKAWENTRFELSTLPDGKPPKGIVPLSLLPVEDVLRFDAGFFPAPREKFLRLWIAQPGAHALAALAADGGLAGYGVIRPCVRGWKIGPLFASEPEAAEALFIGLCGAAGSGPVYLDIPAPNSAAVALAKRFGMTPSFATARMFRDSPRSVDLPGIFGITSFELG